MDEDGTQWQMHNFKRSRAIEMPIGWSGWTDKAALIGMRKTARVFGVLNTKAYEFWQQAFRDERKRPPPLMVDLTQGVQFKSGGTTLGTLLQKSCIYS